MRGPLRTTSPFALAALAAAAVALAAPAAAQTAARRPERLWYMTRSEASFDSFREHVDAIDVVAPQVYDVDSLGVVWGEVDARVLALAREHHVRVVPLLVNAGFSARAIHVLLADSAARSRAIDAMARLARRDGYAGWQLDFEDIPLEDRDALTAFFRQAAAALHADHRELSIAVVPTTGRVPATDYARYMRELWRGAYDVAALADAGDFISLMTYAQHGGLTTPGPIASLPWMRACLDEALAAGVPPAKLSLGLPSYSGYWRTTWDAEHGTRVRGREIGYDRAHALLQQSGATPRWLDDVGASYAFWPVSGTWEWLFLEDARAFRAKLALLREHPGLRGYSVWVLGTEDPAVWRAAVGRR